MQFDNEYFDKWLNDRATKAMEKITNGEKYEQIDVMLLVLKAQTNHIAHMEQDLHGEMRALRVDMDKRFEQADKRIEQVDRRLDSLDKRMDSFMKWSFSCTLIVGGLVVAAIEMLK